MATPTTTWAAMRQQMVTTIKALTPTSLAGDKYALIETEYDDFREWAEKAKNASFRYYEIEDIDDDLNGTQSHDVERRVLSAELVMAYPHSWGTYRTKDANNQWNEAALRALAHEDRNILDKAIGVRGSANYTSGQHAAIVGSVGFEQGEGVTFLVMPLEVHYFHNAS